MLEQNSYSNTVGVPDDMSSRIAGLFAGVFASSREPAPGAASREPANENDADAVCWLDRRAASPRPDVGATRTFGYDAHGLSVSRVAKPRLLELA